MHSIFPFFLMIGSLAVVIVIVVRRFPQLTLLDIDNLPEVKQERKKNEYLKKRIEKRAKQGQTIRLEKIQPFIQKCKEVQLSFRQYVGQIERKILRYARQAEKEKPAHKKQKHDQASRTLLHDAQYAYDEGEFDIAEKKYLDIIRLDTKNIEAYRGLADVYSAQKQYDEAFETYQFVLHLDPHNDRVMVKLAELAEARGDIEGAAGFYQQAVLENDHLPKRFAKLASLLCQVEHFETAIEAIQQAVELEPQNPKYLDSFVEISIMVGDKSLAEEAYRQLRMVNPDNAKLQSFKQRISKIGK